jgi:hypothetical protein
LFVEWNVAPEPFGYTVEFARDLKPTAYTPNGSRAAGRFDVLEASDQVCLLASTLGAREQEHGPHLLARSAYPLGVRPFIKSGELLRSVMRLASQHDWTPLCLDAMGYDRETREFRRDMKRQPVPDAFREMSEQGRQTHQVRVHFRGGADHYLICLFNRYGRAVVEHGDVVVAATGFVLPTAAESLRQVGTLSIRRESTPSRQQLVRLEFPPNTFADPDSVRNLCEALRQGDGLNVTVIHLNPFLHAQVLDYLTGESVQLYVMDDANASLVPRSRADRGTLQRVVATVFRFFGEADVNVERMTAFGAGGMDADSGQ